VLATHRDRYAIATWFSLEPRTSTVPTPSTTTSTITIEGTCEKKVVALSQPKQTEDDLIASVKTSVFSHVILVVGDCVPCPSIALRPPLEVNSLSCSGGGSDVDVDNESIFVSIASYRDPECQHTLRDLFDTAKVW
jgi:hypothetical protein